MKRGKFNRFAAILKDESKIEIPWRPRQQAVLGGFAEIASNPDLKVFFVKAPRRSGKTLLLDHLAWFAGQKKICLPTFYVNCFGMETRVKRIYMKEFPRLFRLDSDPQDISKLDDTQPLLVLGEYVDFTREKFNERILPLLQRPGTKALLYLHAGADFPTETECEEWGLADCTATLDQPIEFDDDEEK